MQTLTSKTTIGVVGTGRMGAALASRLNECGWNVEALFDVDPAASNVLAEEVGAVIAATVADVSELCDVIVTVVSDDAAMQSIFAESGDSLLARPVSKLFINCATLSPAVHAQIAGRCADRGARALVACMAGSIPQARNGELLLICSGDRKTFDHAAPLLALVASECVYVGEGARAAEVKALVNMVMNINTAGLAEGLGLAQALKLDLTMVRDVFSKTGAASRVLETDGADMQAREHDTYFSAEHAAKDSQIALALARICGLDLPLAAATAQQYERMKTLGLGALDKSGIAELTFPSRAQRT